MAIYYLCIPFRYDALSPPWVLWDCWPHCSLCCSHNVHTCSGSHVPYLQSNTTPCPCIPGHSMILARLSTGRIANMDSLLNWPGVLLCTLLAQRVYFHFKSYLSLKVLQNDSNHTYHLCKTCDVFGLIKYYAYFHNTLLKNSLLSYFCHVSHIWVSCEHEVGSTW